MCHKTLADPATTVFAVDFDNNRVEKWRLAES